MRHQPEPPADVRADPPADERSAGSTTLPTARRGRVLADDAAPGPAPRERKAVLLRLDPAVHEALAHWAADDLRSLNGHVEWILRRALKDAGRSPKDAARQLGRATRAPAGGARPSEEPGPAAER